MAQILWCRRLLLRCWSSCWTSSTYRVWCRVSAAVVLEYDTEHLQLCSGALLVSDLLFVSKTLELSISQGRWLPPLLDPQPNPPLPPRSPGPNPPHSLQHPSSPRSPCHINITRAPGLHPHPRSNATHCRHNGHHQLPRPNHQPSRIRLCGLVLVDCELYS